MFMIDGSNRTSGDSVNTYYFSEGLGKQFTYEPCRRTAMLA